jgi:hypothetical protein
MPNQYSKDLFKATFSKYALQKGFKMPPEGDTDMPAGTPTMADLLEAIAEALQEIFEQGALPAKLQAATFKIGPPGPQQPVATKAMPGTTNVKADMTTDPTFFGWIETFHSLLQASYPEPGYGSPDVFATALKTLLAQKPTSINAKITDGSTKVKVTT